jgi:hypothetical protein
MLPNAGLQENALVAARIQSVDPNLNVTAEPASCNVNIS